MRMIGKDGVAGGLDLVAVEPAVVVAKLIEPDAGEPEVLGLGEPAGPADLALYRLAVGLIDAGSEPVALALGLAQPAPVGGGFLAGLCQIGLGSLALLGRVGVLGRCRVGGRGLGRVGAAARRRGRLCRLWSRWSGWSRSSC